MPQAQAAHGQLGDVCVLGLGKTGTDLALYLSGLGEGRVRSVTLYGGTGSLEDERRAGLEASGIRVVLGSEEVEGSYDLAVSSPGISELSGFFRSARAHARECIGEPEFAWRESPQRWLAVTGTNGKTTTTTLATAILREAGLPARSVGNIGTLATDALQDRATGEWFVAELSSFQLAGAYRLHPRVACLLNITPDHLEWHGSLEAYAAAKERVFQNLEAEDLAIVSCGDPWCQAVRTRLLARGLRVLALAEEDHQDPCAAFVREGRMFVRIDGEEQELLGIDELPIKGSHNVQDALAASAMALELGVGVEAVRRALLAFRSLEHRIEPCGEHAGVRFVNDSKATNTDSVEKALTAFAAGRIVLLLGGHDKGTDLASLSHAVVGRCRAAVCFGEAGERIALDLERELGQGGGQLVVARGEHLRDAFSRAVALACPGDTVLLSPACSSFDEFGNMAERGRLFKDLVAALSLPEGDERR